MSFNICPKCEYENAPGSTTCAKCLAPLNPQSSSEQSPPQKTAHSAHKQERVERPPLISKPVSAGFNPAKLIPVIIVILVIAFAGWWFFLKPASPDQVVKNFFAASESGDLEKMKACLSSADIQMFTQMPSGEASIINMMKSSAGKYASTEVGAVLYEDDKAIVTVRQKNHSSQQGTMGDSNKMDIVLIKEDGKWKISFKETMENMFKGFMKHMPN